jgi:hypothetical protein
MINHTFEKGFGLPKQSIDIANFYQKSFALALLNWEINRQEERLRSQKGSVKKY